MRRLDLLAYGIAVIGVGLIIYAEWKFIELTWTFGVDWRRGFVPIVLVPLYLGLGLIALSIPGLFIGFRRFGIARKIINVILTVLLAVFAVHEISDYASMAREVFGPPLGAGSALSNWSEADAAITNCEVLEATVYDRGYTVFQRKNGSTLQVRNREIGTADDVEAHIELLQEQHVQCKRFVALRDQ